MNIEELVREWIEAIDQGKSDGKYNHWAVSYVLDLHFDEKSAELWRFIKLAYREELSERVKGNLAAGPIEDLLAQASETYIDEIEVLAKNDAKFNYLLGGVRQNTTTDDVWERECNVRNGGW